MKTLDTTKIWSVKKNLQKDKKTRISQTSGKTSEAIKQKKLEIHNELKELSSSIPGLSNVFNSNSGILFKLFWLTIIWTNVVICLYQSAERFQYFLDKPIASRVRVVRNSSVKFPSVTFCSPVDINLTLAKYKKFVAKKNKLKSKVKALKTLNFFNISTIWNLINAEELINSSFLFSRTYYLRWESIPKLENKTTVTDHGTCITFSKYDLVTYSGCDAMLLVKIDSGALPYENPPHVAKFSIHTDDDDITYKFGIEFEKLSPQSRIMYGLTARKFIHLNQTNAPCFTKKVVNQCEKRCLEDLIKEKIFCRLPYMSFDDVPLCEDKQTALTAFHISKNIISKFLYSNKCNCSKICDSLTITPRLLIDESRDTVVGLIFDNNAIVTTEEFYAYNFIQLLCDVGGSFGLFLGLCVPALIGIIQSFIICVSKHFFNAKV